MILRSLIRMYQWFIRPIFPSCCRFYPSCSEYAIQSLTVHGTWKGLYLSLRRLARCHPWHPGYIDLVPTREEVKETHGYTPDCII